MSAQNTNPAAAPMLRRMADAYEQNPDFAQQRHHRQVPMRAILPLPKASPGVFSLDIDDTIDLSDGYPAPVKPAHITQLLEQGWIVGTASDREPSEQRAVMEQLGFPDLAFAVPKELLWAVKALVPAQRYIHAGDSAERDRKPAAAQGWEYLTHHEAANFV